MPTTTPSARALWWLLLGLSAAAFGWFVFAVSQRVLYPHELEWMEGALADHAARVYEGLPLYCEPTAEHVPFLYSPMLFWLGAMGMSLGLDGVVALRLIAAGSAVASAMLIGHWVRVETGRVLPGLVAVGLFFAGYGWLAWWYDLARNDALFVFLALAAAYVLRHGGDLRWLWAGLLAAAALLSKQSALMWLPAVGVGCLLWDARCAWKFGVTSALAIGACVGVLHLTSDGWSTFYLFEMPRHHGVGGDRKLGFWTEDLVAMYPLVLLGVLGFVAQASRARGPALYLAAVGSGALLTSYLSRMHVGGFENVMMYGFAGACVLGGVALADEARWLRTTAPALLLLQFGWLGYEAYERGAATLLPSAAHARAHEELRAVVAAQEGPVWIPGHGHIAYRAGKGTGAHGQAIFDLLQLLPPGPGGFDLNALQRAEQLQDLSQRARRALVAFRADVADAISTRRFAAIVLNASTPRGSGTAAFEHPQLFGQSLAGADGKSGTPDDPYARATAPLTSHPDAIAPLVGFDVRRPYALLRR